LKNNVKMSMPTAVGMSKLQDIGTSGIMILEELPGAELAEASLQKFAHIFRVRLRFDGQNHMNIFLRWSQNRKIHERLKAKPDTMHSRSRADRAKSISAIQGYDMDLAATPTL